MPTKISKLEARIVALEAEVAKLRQAMKTAAPSPLRGWEAIVGTMADDELTRRAERAGRRYRQSVGRRLKRTKKKSSHS